MKRSDRHGNKKASPPKGNARRDPDAGTSGEENSNRNVHPELTVCLDVVEELKKQHAAERGEDHSHQQKQLAWTIIAAGLVFLYTFAAFWQANTAYRALVLDERPWVGPVFGSEHLTLQIARGLPITIHMEMKNFGNSPALNETSVDKLTDRPVNVPMPRFDGYSKAVAPPPITLMPNSSALVDFNTAKPNAFGVNISSLTDEDIQNIDTGKIQLFLYGTAWYDDTLGKPHRTDYCYQYIPPTKSDTGGGSFGACSVHNYAD
jgi:hypothetical protein